MTPTPSVSPGPTFDADAAAYLAAVISAGGTGITPTISAATNTLFTSLKSNNLYNDIDVLYLMLGGVSGSTSLNAKRVNSAFDITWNNVGNLTFNYSGVTGGGSGYGNTNYNPNIEASPTDMSWGIYHTAGNMESEIYSFGAATTAGGVLVNNHYYQVPNMKLYGYNNTALVEITGTTAEGSWIGTFNSSNIKTLYKNGGSGVSGAALSTVALANTEYYLFNLNINGGPYPPNFFNGRIQSFFTTNNLTAGQVSTMDSIINTFQTTLGRNLY
jgi:hypothetical protein